MSRALIVFAEDFGRHPASTEHLIRRIAKTRKVVWMNSLGMRRPQLTLKDATRAVSKVGQMLTSRAKNSAAASGAETAAAPTPDGMEIVAPHAVSVPGNALAFQLNRALLSRQVRGIMEKSGVEKPLLWLTLPTALPVVGTLDEHAVIYYCADDFGTLAGIDHKQVLEMERQVVARADLIIVVSDVLAAKFPAAKTIVVPHGVDYDLFATAQARAADLPTGRKIAGFYGSLPHWIDPELIRTTAAAMPDWLFVFIGGGTLFSDAPAPGNCLFLGTRPHHLLPSYVQHWDVSLLPYRDCEPLRAGNPLKLREYLAAGTPIASVDFPALAPYRDLVSMAADAAAFPAAIRAASKDQPRNDARRRVVLGGTWEARAARSRCRARGAVMIMRRGQIVMRNVLVAFALASSLLSPPLGLDALALDLGTGALPLKYEAQSATAFSDADEIVIEGVVRDTLPAAIGLRIDDAASTTYATRYNDERKIPPGPFRFTVGIKGLKTPSGRVLDQTTIKQIIVFAWEGSPDVSISRFEMARGEVLPVNAKGFAFGALDASVPSGFERIGPSGHPRIGCWRRAGGASAWSRPAGGQRS